MARKGTTNLRRRGRSWVVHYRRDAREAYRQVTGDELDWIAPALFDTRREKP